MVRSGNQQQLQRIYRDTRSPVLEESLRKLGVEKLSKDDVQKMQWEVLEAKIGNWIHFMRIAVKLLFAGQRKVCGQIFEGFDTLLDQCFSPEKLFALLNMYEIMRELYSELSINIEATFPRFESGGDSNSQLAAVTMLIMPALQTNLDGKSKHYRDTSLTHLFLMNNTHKRIIWAKIFSFRFTLISTETLSRLNFGIFFLVFGSGVPASADGGNSSGISRAIIKDRLNTFNIQFEELHQRQSQWTVPDMELRGSLGLAVAEVVIVHKFCEINSDKSSRPLYVRHGYFGRRRECDVEIEPFSSLLPSILYFSIDITRVSLRSHLTMDPQANDWRTQAAALFADWRRWGHHPAAAVFWGGVGIVAAVFAPTYFLPGHTHTTVLFMILSPIVAISLYILGYKFRLAPLLRRRGWVDNVVGNGIASAITILTAVCYKHTSTDHILVALAVFALMEIAKPASDFGLLQFFLRQPLLSAILFYIGEGFYGLGRWHVYTLALLAFGSLWHPYFLHLFEMFRAALADAPRVIYEVEPQPPVQPELPVQLEPPSPLQLHPQSPLELEPEPQPQSVQPESPVQLEPPSPLQLHPQSPLEPEPEPQSVQPESQPQVPLETPYDSIVVSPDSVDS
ncbi:hypothetical protein BUALT_Bualt07G0004900 [Buddleja alternifolia]|uniref:Exocyst subunit Exo70 family protein n=1 Tax=Buddleja alternifolia TaxID=168488 RepID=A0AAV6XHJ3_9LAMI|nr:hypothetical protein BUALT_Bualt07G0004900 [Buddleja alternifolia]